jgi:hypothetical protein
LAIEHVIIEVLLSDPKVKDYCGSDVFMVSAPSETKRPYITIVETDKPAGDDIVNEFEITIEMYDNDKDKSKAIALSQHLKQILHRAKGLEDKNGAYSNIRLYFQERGHIEESDNTLPRMFITFSARAIEEIIEE